MAAEQAPQGSDRRPGTDTAGSVVGLLVFIAGIAMIGAVFIWTYRLFENIDEEIGRTQISSPRPRVQPPSDTPGTGPGGDSGEPTGTSKPSPVQKPPEAPGVAQVAAILGLKILALLVLALCGSLVAAKGAQLAGAYRGKPT